jgi:hypothetical protein
MMSFIRSNLRLASRKWGPIQQAKANARKPYVGDNKRQKWTYLCDACGEWFKGSETAVHHKHPCGTLKDWCDIEMFARNLFVEADGFRVLCTECHADVHAKEKADAKETRD